jgi:class 3 adenylate cyclase/tetratricopeptide (TPR) repeat protein
VATGKAGEADAGVASADTAATARALQGERRQATILAADISNYTALCSRMDAEQVQALLDRVYARTDNIIAAFGGHVIDHAGDGVLAVFGAPVAHGDDPERAVRAALELHAAVAQVSDPSGEPIALHIGMAAGEVVAAVMRGGVQPKYAVTGDAVNLAARLSSLARSGETFVSESLYRSLSQKLGAHSLGETMVKGFAAPVQVWRVLGWRAAEPQRSPFVGRQLELRQLTGVLEAARDTGCGTAVAVRGEPGIGKSRLVEELQGRAHAGGFACHVGRAMDFGVGRAQDALSAILLDILGAGVAADEHARRAVVQRGLQQGLIAADHEAMIDDLLELEQRPELRAVFDAMDNATRSRRSTQALLSLVGWAAQRQPRLLVVEDIHWASPVLLTYLAALTTLARQAPMILVMTTRFEGDPLDKQWRAATHGSPLLTIDLGPLLPAEARTLAAGLIEASRLAEDCIERAEGNPLFLEQLVRNARESHAEQIPATIQSLVLARMDRLAPQDKAALQAASIIGKRFALETLRRLIDDDSYRCDRLLASDLVRPEGTDFLFAHALIQEGVYSSLLHSRRRELHRKAAQLYAHHEPVVHAEHLDRAEDPGAARAYLDAAADLARKFRYEAALRLAERGVELAADDPVRCALAMLRGDLLRETGRSQESIAAFHQAVELAAEPGERCHAWMGIAGGHRITGDFPPAMDALAQAQPIAERLGLVVECSKIHHTRGNLYFAQGEVERCAAEHRAALEFAERAGDAECEAQALSGLGDALYAQGRMLTALDYFRRCVEQAQRADLLRVEVPNRAMIAHCLQYRLEIDAAAKEAYSACEVAQRAGLVQNEMFIQETLGVILVGAGRYEEGETALQRSLALARAAGARRYQSADLYCLALRRLAQGRREEANEHLREALDLARQTGMGFLGPAVFGGLARAAGDALERGQALREGERLLRDRCLAHCHLWFYRDAIEATLECGEWDATLHYCRALEEFVSAEPLPWAQLLIRRGRVLAAFGRGERSASVQGELQSVRDEALNAGLVSAVPALEAALAAA